jgi:hypothetical protein
MLKWVLGFPYAVWWMWVYRAVPVDTWEGKPVFKPLHWPSEYNNLFN